MKPRYQVAVTDGWIIDSEGRYVRDAIRRDCGHLHRSYEAAQTCRTKLLNWSKDGQNCSAAWYNSTILTMDSKGNQISDKTETTTGGVCEACGTADGKAGIHLCETCETKYSKVTI